jgi:ankyrin repeat protein
MGMMYTEQQKRLLTAARSGDIAEISQLISEGMDIDCELKYSSSALILASARGQEEVVRILLAAGAKANRRNYFGVSPILEATERGFVDIVRLLVNSGADVNLRHNNGKTAILAATVKRDRKMIKTLLELGADADLEDFEGWSAKRWAEAESDVGIQALFGLRKGESEVNNMNEHSVSSIDGVSKPLENGGVVEGAFWAMFMRAASAGDTRTVRRLVQDGVEIDGQSPNGTTALIAAVKNGHAETAFELIDLGADISLADNDGVCAIEWAKRKGVVMLVKGLEERAVLRTTGDAAREIAGEISEDNGH